MEINVKIPNLFVIGSSKCATTTLWSILKDHPQIFMSEEKEPSFFIKNDYKKRMLSYLSYFEKAENEKYLGEASPGYAETTIFPEVPKRIFDFNPNAKLIYIVREPIDRLKSIWKQTLYSGHWYRNFYELDFDRNGIGLMPLDLERAIFDYPRFLEETKYWTHLNAYRKYFSDENILLLYYEDLKKNQSILNQQIFSFLNLENIINPQNKHINKSSIKKRLPFWFKNRSLSTQFKIKYLLPPIVFDRLIKKPLGDVELTKELEKKIYENLKDEISNILEYGVKPSNFWSNR